MREGTYENERQEKIPAQTDGRCDAKFLICEISDYNCRTAHAQTWMTLAHKFRNTTENMCTYKVILFIHKFPNMQINSTIDQLNWHYGEILWLNRANHKTELVVLVQIVLKPLILFCDWRDCTKTTNSVLWLARFNQRISPLNQSLRDVSIYYLLSKALESRVGCGWN
jgi:hypothetical protein